VGGAARYDGRGDRPGSGEMSCAPVPRGVDSGGGLRHAALGTLYDDIWRASRPHYLRRDVVVEDIPIEGSARWGISAVLRPSTVHVFYGPEDLHVTVRSIEGYREAVSRGDHRVSLYERVLRRALEHLGPVTVEFAGLTASRSSVLLQGWPVASLQDFRNRLYDMLSEVGAIVSGPELSRSSIRKTCHATLALIGGPLEAPERFVEFIDAHRATYYGRITFRQLELVRYHRTAAQVAVESLGTLPFRG